MYFIFNVCINIVYVYVLHIPIPYERKKKRGEENNQEVEEKFSIVLFQSAKSE